MTTDAIADLVGVETARLAPLLFEGISLGLASANRAAFILPHAKYPHIRPQLLRCYLREHIEQVALPHGWGIGGDSTKMGQLYLANPEHKMYLRLLKERRHTYPGGVPVAGHNKKRRAAFQGAFPLPAEYTRLDLLLLWDFEDGLDSFTLRVVHPTEAGVYGRPVHLDLDIAILPDGGIQERRRFVSDPEEDDLFAAEIYLQENRND